MSDLHKVARKAWAHFNREMRKIGRGWGKDTVDPLAEKAQYIDRLNRYAEDGQILLVWSGMDCDCVQFSGDVQRCKATFYAVEKAIEDTLHYAEGPMHFYFERPSARDEIVRTSRDLVLEAFEDGHPHVVYA